MVMKIISKAKNCSMFKFLECVDGDLSVLVIEGKPEAQLVKEAFENILTEFYDLSGIDRDIEEIELIRRVKYLEYRNRVVASCVIAQRQAVTFLGNPFEEDFDLLSNNGYAVYWNGNIEDFIYQLECIESAEASYIGEYEQSRIALEQYYKNNDKAVSTNSRTDVLRLINSVEKVFGRIDIKTFSVERFAVMLSDLKALNDMKNASLN